MMWRLFFLLLLCQHSLASGENASNASTANETSNATEEEKGAGEGEGEAGEGEAGEGEAGEGEEAEGEAEGEAEPAGDPGSLMLLASVALTMTMFYLVNSHVHGVADNTWDAISTSISIFVAVMGYNMVNELLYIVEDTSAEPTPWTEKANLGWVSVASAFCQLIGWYVVVGCSIYVQRGSKLRLTAMGTLGGHILGFAAIGVFHRLTHVAPFNESPWMLLVVMLIYVVGLPLFSVCVLVPLHKCLFTVFKVPEEERKACKEQCVDMGDDFFAMGLSFIISFFLKALIIDAEEEVVNHEWSEEIVESVHCWILFVIGILFVVFTAVSKFVHVSKVKNKEGNLHHACEVAITTLAMTIAWCMVGSMYWLFFKEVQERAHITVAALFTMLFVIVVLVFGKLKDKGISFGKGVMRAEMTALALALALSWEKTFDVALEGASNYAAGGGSELKAVFTFGMTLVLVLTVYPAWVVYIIPKTDEEVFESVCVTTDVNGVENGVKRLPRLPPWHAFCDCGVKRAVRTPEVVDDQPKQPEVEVHERTI